jgi:hypothetical protein
LNQVSSKSIEVEEYSLPAFSAQISAPKAIPLSDGKVSVTVGAQYTFGQKVQGNAVVTFKQYGYQIVHERSVVIDSSSLTFDIDIKNDLKIDILHFDMEILAEIQFTDKQTGQLASAVTQFSIVLSRHSIILKGMENFKPGLPYVFSVFVKNLDGSPAPENSEIIVQTSFNDVISPNTTFKLDSMGSLELEEKVPLNTSYMEITVSIATISKQIL